MPPVSKSRELAELLKFKIITGELLPGAQLEAIPRLASFYKTTIATMSKALERLEQYGLIERIASKGVFVRAKPSVTLAIVLDEMLSGPLDSMTIVPLFLSEMDRACRQRHWRYELFFHVEDRESAQDFVQKLNRNAFDAVIIASKYIAQHYAQLFQHTAVYVAGLFPYKELPHAMSVDLYRLVYDAVIELSRRDCETIVLFDNDRDQSWSSQPDAVPRGYADALARIGKGSTSHLHYHLPISIEGGCSGLARLLDGPHGGHLGIISVDSLITTGLIREALARNLRIPRDIMIASQAHRGGGEALSVVPIIKYESNLAEYAEQLCREIQDFLKGAPQPYGIFQITARKSVTANSALLSAQLPELPPELQPLLTPATHP